MRHNFCFEIYQMQIRNPLKLRFEVLFHKNYDHLNKRATPERKSSVLPLLQKMYRNIGEDAVQYVPSREVYNSYICVKKQAQSTMNI